MDNNFFFQFSISNQQLQQRHQQWIVLHHQWVCVSCLTMKSWLLSLFDQSGESRQKSNKVILISLVSHVREAIEYVKMTLSHNHFERLNTNNIFLSKQHLQEYWDLLLRQHMDKVYRLIDWCCCHYFTRNSLVALLEALFTVKVGAHDWREFDNFYTCMLMQRAYAYSFVQRVLFLSAGWDPLVCISRMWRECLY